MLAQVPFSVFGSRVLAFGIASLLFCASLFCQIPSPRSGPQNPNSQQTGIQGFEVSVGVRDSRGVPLDVGSVVHLYAVTGSFNVTESTRDASTARFSNVTPGDYQLEVTSPGYRKATEQLSLFGNRSEMPVYVYMTPDSEPAASNGNLGGTVMSPQLRSDVEKALLALHKKQFEIARKILDKASQKAPGNPDVVYFLGVAELGLQHTDLAREDFRKALTLDSNHELALVSLGELQMQSGETAQAITSFEKAVSTGRAGWRAHFQLASAYFKLRRLNDAESEASRAAHLAKDKGAAATFLLGEIQYAEGKREDAKKIWATILSGFPSDPIASEAKKMLARQEEDSPQNDSATAESLPPPSIPDVSLVTVVERPWAPPDLDSAVYDVAPQVDCKTDQILDRALHRLKSELADFEKFTATEHIEHQQVDRYGWPGPVKTHDFSYIVVIYPFENNSFYLEESRGIGGNDLSSFPTSLATIGLNGLGVSVLQPYYRAHFDYSCEGLTNLRGQAAWQVHFLERIDSKVGGVREWKKGGKVYDIPIKGRIWISSASYALLRIETELRNPVEGLELTKDHLIVDYGPVKFTAGNEQLWLPWSAEMFMEFHGKRYHHRHFLSDYMLFGVDTTHKIGKPKELPPAAEVASP